MFFFRNDCVLVLTISLLIIYYTSYWNGVAGKHKFLANKNLHERNLYSSKIESAKKRLERNARQGGDVKEKYFERNSTVMVDCFFKESEKFKYEC